MKIIAKSEESISSDKEKAENKTSLLLRNKKFWIVLFCKIKLKVKRTSAKFINPQATLKPSFKKITARKASKILKIAIKLALNLSKCLNAKKYIKR